MQVLTYHMRLSVLDIARRNKSEAKGKINYYLQKGYSTLEGDELDEFLRDVVVLEIDVEQL